MVEQIANQIGENHPTWSVSKIAAELALPIERIAPLFPERPLKTSRKASDWSEDRLDELKRKLATKLSVRKIANEMGLTVGQVTGAINRHKLRSHRRVAKA